MQALNDLSGQWAVVTGADSGIGEQFAVELAHRRCNIVAISNRAGYIEAAAQRLSERYGVQTMPFCIDLCDSESSTRIMDFLDTNRIIPYILINNAGIFSFDFVTDTPASKIDRFIDLHVRTVTQLSRLMADKMKTVGTGRILNMSSMSCWMPMPGIAMYSATKAYIRVFSRSLHYEMRDFGIGVTVACPGGIATDLFGLPKKLQRLAVRLGVLQTPETFVRHAVKKMLKGHKQYINGWLNRFSIFFIGITPDWIRMMVKRRMLDKNIRRP